MDEDEAQRRAEDTMKRHQDDVVLGRLLSVYQDQLTDTIYGSVELFPERPLLSRWRRYRNRLRNYKLRVSHAWQVLRHDTCPYEDW